MLVYCMLAITLILALLSMVIIWRNRTKLLSHCWSSFIAGTTLATFVYLYGTWVFISVYGKYIFGICFLLLLIVSLLAEKVHSSKRTTKKWAIVNGGLAAAFFILSILYFTGTTTTPYGIAHLALPFKKGTYFVFQGGKGLPTNIFHFGGRRTVYAMDIIKLNTAGNRAKNIFSKQLEDYEIFNDTIYSPCNGVILKTESNNPDNIPPARKRGPTNLNQVLIATDSTYIFLGHLKQNSVFVKKGDTVFTGQPLGLAGNSGSSLEPHLHIQAHAKTNPNLPWYKEPQLLIKFNGKSYLLFEEIRTGL